ARGYEGAHSLGARGYEGAHSLGARGYEGAHKYPLPTWPRLKAYGTLYGAMKSEWQTPLTLDGPFDRETTLRLHVLSVSQRSHLIVDADGKTVLDKDFVCGPGEGEWNKAVFREQWGIYQNEYDRDYEALVPAGTEQVRVHVTDGDWMQLSELGAKRTGDPQEATLSLLNDWGQKPAALRYEPGRPEGAFGGTAYEDRDWLWRTMIEPWKNAESQGIGAMVGEFGAFNKTPHDVVLRWMEDSLANWQKAGWGWAQWNFRGSFGILDSGRADVQYEDWEGHKLDRQMLELLLRY
ncbi:MAG: glycoside hydrolase, partial [Armatimonadetes bacterium]|nr:glycoside hydrolase [Armatimonadota bacterium]